MKLQQPLTRPLAAFAAAFLLTIGFSQAQTSFTSATGKARLTELEGGIAPAPPPPGGIGKAPSLLIPVGPAERPKTAVQKAIEEANRRFQSGKFYIQEEKPEEARREFDAALSVLLELPAELADRSAAERRFEELIRLIHGYEMDLLAQDNEGEQKTGPASPLQELLELTFPVDPKLKDRVSAQTLAGQSQLPLTVNDAVLSYVNYFTSAKGSRTLLAGMRRSGRYRDMILRVFAEEGVPRELIHLAQAESGFQPGAVSRKAATGMWQFIRSRGQEYGLDSSKLHDERLDPEKATRAAAKHLRDLYQQTGDWHLAMAAYNCGPYCVERAVQRTGFADYWELRKRSVLPKETRNYVPAILAMAIVSANLGDYGMESPDLDSAVAYDTIEVDTETSLALIADAADVPVAQIKELNPSILRGIAPDNYEVHVPKGRGDAALGALEAVPAERRRAWRLHRIQSGDTLAGISKQYSTAAALIVKANTRFDEAFFESPVDGEVVMIPARETVYASASSSKSRRRVVRRSSGSASKVASGSRKAGTTKVAATKSKKRAVAR